MALFIGKSTEFSAYSDPDDGEHQVAACLILTSALRLFFNAIARGWFGAGIILPLMI